MLLPQISYKGQLALKSTKLAIIGCGGIGCPASLYLASSGIGTLGLFDSDKVQLNNLHRQIAHRTSTIGHPKTLSLKSALLSLNPHTQINTHQFITQSTLSTLDQYDIIIDGSDNPKCRYLVNDYCRKNNKVLFSGACVGWETQITAFDSETACYRCLWGDDQVSTGGCSTRGVVGMIPGLVGLIVGLEVLKYVVMGSRDLFGSMMLYDGLTASTKKIKLRKKKENCIVCSSNNMDEFHILTYDYTKYDPPCGSSPPQVPSIQWNQIIQKKIPSSMIIDVRSQSMFNIIHLKGTTNIPYDELKRYEGDQKVRGKVQKVVKEEEGEKKVYVMCRRGNDSKRAVQVLREKGYQAVNVVGGIERYGKDLQVGIPSI